MSALPEGYCPHDCVRGWVADFEQPCPIHPMHEPRPVEGSDLERLEHVIATGKEFRRHDYHAYLRTEEWDRRRRHALLRCDKRCQGCGSSTLVLHVHHLTYERLGCELPEDLLVLCAYCHKTAHAEGLVLEPFRPGSFPQMYDAEGNRRALAPSHPEGESR